MKTHYTDGTPFHGIFREIPMSGQIEKEKMYPLYTTEEYDTDLPSAHKIYMNSENEYDAAIKLVGSYRFWINMVKTCVKIRRVVDEWRDEKLLKDQSIARALLWRAAEDGNVAAAKVLYESRKEEADKKARSVAASRKETSEKDLITARLAMVIPLNSNASTS